MTDDSKFKAPRALGFSRTQPSAGTSRVRRTEDPLAELARLIGQEDPFADFSAARPADSHGLGNGGAQQNARAPEPRRADVRQPLAPSRKPDSYDDEADGQETFSETRGNGRSAYAYGQHRVPPAPTRTFRDDGLASGRMQGRGEYERRSSDGLDPDAYREQERRRARRAPAAPVQDQDDGYEEYAGTEYDPDYVDDAYIPAHGDEFYEEAPRRSLKGWMLAGTAAAAIVIVGVSGLFAYRAIFNVEDSGSPPVTIRPEAGPTKVVPGSDAKTAEAGGNKRIYDRLGGERAPGGERIVSREERPVDPDRIPQGVPPAAPTQTARPAAGTVTAVPPVASGSPSQAAPLAPPATVTTEPRRVRTVTVRSDGTIIPSPAGSAPASSTARTGPAAASDAPLALQGNQASASQTAVLPPPRPPAASTAPRTTDNPWANLSASGQYAAPGAPAQTQAALPPQPAPPPPAIAVNTPPPAGSYVVQVAAQKTEADAQATWQALQQRYPAILGSQPATIRRVDLGERGIFYRAQVGPFSTRAQASEVCQSLKAAGGECVIQRN